MEFQEQLKVKIGPLLEQRWPVGNNISTHLTPPDDGEEDDEYIPPPYIHKNITPFELSEAADGLVSVQTKGNENLLLAFNCNQVTFASCSKDHHRQPTRCLSSLDRTKRRLSTMVSSAAAAVVSRRLSATIGWCLTSHAHDKPHVIQQGRALCLQYIKTQIRRAASGNKKKIIMKRLQRMIESECAEEAAANVESGVVVGMRALCAALERKRPDAFRQVARQATRAPSAMLRSDTALAELALALARRITRENITWSKIAAVFCVCGALAREAVEAAEDVPPAELVAAPAAAIADLLHEEPCCWIVAHGGWTGLVERLRSSECDQRSEKTLRVMVSVFAGICLVLLLLRWALHGHEHAVHDHLQ